MARNFITNLVVSVFPAPLSPLMSTVWHFCRSQMPRKDAFDVLKTWGFDRGFPRSDRLWQFAQILCRQQGFAHDIRKRCAIDG